MSTLRWALIGASDVASTRMLPAMRRLGQTPVSVYSSARPHADRYAAREGIGRPTDSLAEVLDGVDAAYISTRNPEHGMHTRAALNAGVHVLCEKPVTLDLDEAVGLIQLARTRGLVLAVNHHLPSAPVVRTVARLVHDGAVGDLLGIRLDHAVLLPERLRTWRVQDLPGAGVVYDVTVHDAAVVDLLVGCAPASAVALAVRQGPWPTGAVDAVMSVLRWDDDLLCQTHDAFAVPHNVTGLTVHGTAGTVVATDALTQDPVGDVVLRDVRGARDIDVGPRTDLYESGLADFARAVAGSGEPAVDGLRGAQAVATAIAVAAAADTGATVDVVDVARRLTPPVPV